MKQLIFILCLFSVSLNAQINIIDGDTVRTIGVGMTRVDSLAVRNVPTALSTSPYFYAVFDSQGRIKIEPSVNTLSPVLDNTITTPPTTPGVDDAYLIPTGATGTWTSNVNKIATWSGATWSYYTPVTNDKTTVQTGTNTGLTYTFDGTTWVLSSVKNQLKVYNWLLTDNYKATDLVIYNNAIYQANGDIPVNTVFTTGTAGATWKQLGVSGASEDYYVSATSLVTLNTTAQTLLSITVTSPGRYEIETLLDFSLSYNQPIAYYIAKNGTSISQTKGGYQNTTASGAIAFTNGKAKAIVNLVAGDIITLRAYASFASPTVNNREMFIKKIAGYLPVVLSSGSVLQMKAYSGTTALPGDLNTFTTRTVNLPTFTPKSTNSDIIIELDADYIINTFGADEWKIQILEGSTVLYEKKQVFNNNSGGGTRSSTLLPLTGVVSNGSLSTRTFSIKMERVSGDDTMQLYTYRSLNITEVQK